MKLRIIISAFFVITSLLLNGQIRTISGKIIDEDLETLPKVSIQDSDTALIGETDLDGKFVIEIPIKLDTLIISYIGMEWKTIQIPKNCDTIDIVLMYEVIYDFITLKKVDRLRMKRFKKLPEIHKTAYEKGLFTTNQPCYFQSFNPYYIRSKKNLK